MRKIVEKLLSVFLAWSALVLIDLITMHNVRFYKNISVAILIITAQTVFGYFMNKFKCKKNDKASGESK